MIVIPVVFLIFFHPTSSCWQQGSLKNYTPLRAVTIGRYFRTNEAECIDYCMKTPGCLSVSKQDVLEACSLHNTTEWKTTWKSYRFALIRDCPHVDDTPGFTLERTSKEPDVGPTEPYIEGFLIYKNGTVCGKGGFNFLAANLACHSMGHLGALAWWTTQNIDYNLNKPITMSSVTCEGQTWSSCSFLPSNANCSHRDDVVLMCAGDQRKPKQKEVTEIPYEVTSVSKKEREETENVNVSGKHTSTIVIVVIIIMTFVSMSLFLFYLRFNKGSRALTNQQEIHTIPPVPEDCHANPHEAPEQILEHSSYSVLTPSAPHDITNEEESLDPPGMQERGDLGNGNSAPPLYHQIPNEDDEPCPSYDDVMLHSQLYNK